MKYSLAITKKTLKEYLDMLPISYYLKVKVECDITDAEVSYFDLNEHKIMISIKQLNSLTYDKRPTRKDIEKDIRCMLYHEVSHAILTPTLNLQIRKDLFNIFEDERIETLLSTYFINVNFKEFVKRINNYKKNMPAKDVYQFFYSLVRFREGPAQLLHMVDKIIYKARYITSKYTTHHIDRWKGVSYTFTSYQIDIMKLYWECEKYFNKTEHNSPIPEEQTNEESTTIIAKSPNTNPFEQELKKEEKTLSNNPNESFRTPNNETTFLANKNQENEIKNDFDQMCARNHIDSNLLSQELSNYIKFTIKSGKEKGDSNFKAKLRPIILRYKGMLKQNGGSRLGYSGRINPRLTINKDFKWFEHSGGKSIKRGYKVQLNLFIDRSNSFSNNEQNVNNMLYELDNLEKELKDVFEYRLITMGGTIDIAKNSSRRISCNGGTTLDASWKKTIDKVQNPSNDNINIVLFDGKVYTKENKHLFSLFNKNNFIIISDVENNPAIKQYCKNTRKNIIAKEGTYVKELLNNIIKVLNFAIR